MHANRIENILQLPPEERYSYTIREIAKLEEVWVIATPENIVTIADESGEEILPIWPHKEVAERCVFKEMKHDGWYPKSIRLSTFIERCVPDMEQMDVVFGVFYDESRECLSVNAKRLLVDLHDEI